MARYGFPLVSKNHSFNINLVRTNPNGTRAKQIRGELGSSYARALPKRYMYLLDEPYRVSDYCCTKLKKSPFKSYEKQTGLFPILGTMASESQRRQADYLKRGGCNVFESKQGRPTSMPLSIWTEKDVLDCIERYNIPIADIYRKGATRTGCMFCGYGCQLKGDHRLRLLFDLYPKWYNHFMNYTNNGVTYREALRKVLAVNGLYLPDEKR